MQPLVQPRKAWSIPPVPPYYDSLNFYKFITKCRLINIKEATEELAQNYYKSLHLPTAKFEVFTFVKANVNCKVHTCLSHSISLGIRNNELMLFY
jgi:hypothetical protein